MIFTRSHAYFNSTKRIILRVCGWYLHFRLVFPGSDRIITLGIKDFERKCTYAKKYLCLHLHGTDWSWSQFVYFHVKVCFDLYPSKWRRKKKLNGRFINCLKNYRYTPSVRMSGKILALKGKHYENMARKEL